MHFSKHKIESRHNLLQKSSAFSKKQNIFLHFCWKYLSTTGNFTHSLENWTPPPVCSVLEPGRVNILVIRKTRKYRQQRGNVSKVLHGSQFPGWWFTPTPPPPPPRPTPPHPPHPPTPNTSVSSCLLKSQRSGFAAFLQWDTRLLASASPTFKISKGRGSQRDVVFLGWPTAPRICAQMRGKGGGVAGSQPMSTAIHKKPNKFCRLTPYLTWAKASIQRLRDVNDECKTTRIYNRMVRAFNSQSRIATVRGSITATSTTVESEGRQMKQCWIKWWKNLKIVLC
jgi:hypothetical protein